VWRSVQTTERSLLVLPKGYICAGYLKRICAMSLFFVGPKRPAEQALEEDVDRHTAALYGEPSLDSRPRLEVRTPTQEDIVWAFEQAWFHTPWDSDESLAHAVRTFLRTHGYDPSWVTPETVMRMYQFRDADPRAWAQLAVAGDKRNNEQTRMREQEQFEKDSKLFRHFNS
jgi:hypothetical protein